MIASKKAWFRWLCLLYYVETRADLIVIYFTVYFAIHIISLFNVFNIFTIIYWFHLCIFILVIKIEDTDTIKEKEL